MQKPTRATINARIEEVLRIRLDGAEFWDVREYVREKCTENKPPWECEKCLSDAQIYRYIARADKLIAESCRSSRKRLLRRHLAQRRNLFGKATNSGDVRTALACLESEARLLGLFDAPSKSAKTETPPVDAADVVKLLGNRLKEIDESDLPASERVKLTTALAGSLLQAISTSAIETQLRELLDRLEEQEKRKGQR
jgi:hypothetical protein